MLLVFAVATTTAASANSRGERAALALVTRSGRDPPNVVCMSILPRSNPSAADGLVAAPVAWLRAEYPVTL